MAIKLADTLAPMSEFPAAMAEHIGFSDGATLQEKFDNKELGGGDSSVTLTQEGYEALTEEEKLDGLYYTYDTKRIYKNGVQYGASEPIPLTMKEFKILKEAGALDAKQEYLVEADAEGILLGAEDIGYDNAGSGIQATTVQGAIDKVSEKVDSKAEINDTISSETSTYSSAKINTLNANRQVKTFDNSGASTEKWYKICSALTTGIGCNIKLTASRADSTATVQYFSALYRDSRYRYTSSYISRERTVYESELVAEYSAYIIADANNDIWVHVPSYGKAIIEIDTRAITIDGTAGTPVKDYVYSSFESQTIKDKFERINIKQFNHPGSNTSFKYVTITSGGNGVGGLELNVPYAGKYMFSTPKSEPVYFGSSTHKGYTLNGWAWSDDGKTLYLRVAGFAPFSISVLGSVPKDTSVNNIITISDMTSTAPEGIAFVSSPVYSNAVINDSSTGNTTSTWSSSKIASEINPTIDISKVFSNGTLNIATLGTTYGAGRYVIVGQGTAGNGSATIDIWTLASNAISYIVNVTYSNKTSNTFIGLTYENPTINFETNYLSACNHIAKVCTLV